MELYVRLYWIDECFDFRGDTHQLMSYDSAGEMLQEIMHHAGIIHMTEAALSHQTQPVYSILPQLRSKMTQLQRRLEVNRNYECPGDYCEHHLLYPIIHHNIRSLKSQLLTFRKLYRYVYYNYDLHNHLRRLKARLIDVIWQYCTNSYLFILTRRRQSFNYIFLLLLESLLQMSHAKNVLLSSKYNSWYSLLHQYNWGFQLIITLSDHYTIEW